MNNYPPDLTYACELEVGELQALFANPEVIPFLQSTHAAISLGILDLSEERAAVARALNDAGIPLTAWLLLPREQGYWFNLDNYPQAVARYEQFMGWTQAHGLKWTFIGLDIEPDLRGMKNLAARRLSGIGSMLRNIFNLTRLRRGASAYQQLIKQIHADGYAVETYQFPFIVDERMAHSTLLQRMTGLVDLPGTDREVLMLYSSFIRPWGQGVLWSYAAQAQGVGVGITGQGMETETTLVVRPMNWAELETDLRLAYRRCSNIFLYSLEGCVEQNFLPMLRDFDWQGEVKAPVLYAQRTENYRRLFRRMLWLAAKPAWMLFALALLISAQTLIARRRR